MSFNPLSSADVLDCSLRDGGYYTSWDFAEPMVETYLRAMASLPIKSVELGYVNPVQAGYHGEYYYLSPERTAWAKSLIRSDQQLAVMFDEKAVTPSQARQLLAEHRGHVDAVRIAVAPSRLREGTELLEAIREAGFKSGGNIMHLSKYWADATGIPSLAAFVAASDCVALVDSYGSCTPEHVKTSTEAIVDAFPDSVVGFHGHDNLGLAFANSLQAVQSGATVVDGTMTGMGRGPGNTKTEALLIQRSRGRESALDMFALEQGLRPFLSAQKKFGWGTNLAYMISGAAGLPQNEVMDWLGKHRYSTAAIVQALGGQVESELDNTAFPAPLPDESNAVMLIVGGGSTVRTHAHAIADYVRAVNPVVVHANYQNLDLAKSIGAMQFYCIAGDVADRLKEAGPLPEGSQVVVPTPPRFRGSVPSDFERIVQIEPLEPLGPVGSLGPVSDTAPLALGLGMARHFKSSSVVLVGFDGYETANSAQQELSREIESMLAAFQAAHNEVNVFSATPSLYDVQQRSIYGLLSELR